MKTPEEMMLALLDGHKLRHESWDTDIYVYLGKQSGEIHGSLGSPIDISFSRPERWDTYVVPPKPEKIKFYGQMDSYGHFFLSQSKVVRDASMTSSNCRRVPTADCEHTVLPLEEEE